MSFKLIANLLNSCIVVDVNKKIFVCREIFCLIYVCLCHVKIVVSSGDVARLYILK